MFLVELLKNYFKFEIDQIKIVYIILSYRLITNNVKKMFVPVVSVLVTHEVHSFP